MTGEDRAGTGVGPAPDAAATQSAAYGSWASPLDIELITGTAIAIAEPQLDGDDVYWLESRPAQRGRRTLLRRGLDGVVRELTPDPFSVRSRVHEYGGGSYAADGGRVIASGGDDRLYRLDPDAVREAEPITPEGTWRYADLVFDPAASRCYAVRETHDPDRPTDPALVRNEIVALALDGSDGPGRVLVAGPDFVSDPRPSPDGSVLAWLEWDQPDMPWDSTRLRVAPVLPDGGIGEARTVAGGPGISIVWPWWRRDGTLHLVSDETGWWNLYAFDGPDGLDGPARSLAPMEAELAGPAWVFGRPSYGFLPDGSVLAVARSGGHDRFVRIRSDGETVDVPAPGVTEIDGLRVAGDEAVAIVAGPTEGASLERLDVGTLAPAGVLARSLSAHLDPAYLPEPEAISFPTTGGATARAIYFAPSNPRFRGPAGERPPLLVLSHGGPTSSAWSALSLDRAFFTSRGIAVVDVDYRGSTGYGRPYRDALQGNWGIYDVDDCIAAAQFLVERGDADPARLAIRGGSAGGYTTLAALAFRPEVFAAGISLYGIADLELIHVDGHKFEGRYDEGLLAPWTEEGRKVFRERSPIHAMDRVRAPLLIFQGLDDRVVPPSQLDAMVAALTSTRTPHVAITFEGEGHGFRRADTKRAVYEAELAFLGRVFGFDPADDLPPLEVPGLE